MISDKVIRIILTGAILLLGGYYIQKSSRSLSSPTADAERNFIDSVRADVPCSKC